MRMDDLYSPVFHYQTASSFRVVGLRTLRLASFLAYLVSYTSCKSMKAD